MDLPYCFRRCSSAFICFLSIVFICFYNSLPRGEYVNLACSITCLSLEGNILLPVRNSYLSNFPDNNAAIFSASLLISYCIFSSQILSSIIMISFYILSKRFYLKHDGLFCARVAPIAKKEYEFAIHFFKDS